MTSLIDGKGISFGSYHSWLPRAAADRSIPDRRTDLRVRRNYAKAHSHCLMCGSAFADGFLEGRNVHHLIGGTPGRSDEATNLAALCGLCHDEVTSGPLGLSHVLYAKWEAEAETLDWCRLHLLRGRSLPVPIKATFSVTPRGRTRICDHCHGTYEYRRRTSLFCSTRCRVAAARSRSSIPVAEAVR